MGIQATPDRGVLIPDRSVPASTSLHCASLVDVLPALNNPLPQAAATLGRGGPPFPQRTGRPRGQAFLLAPPSSLPAGAALIPSSEDPPGAGDLIPGSSDARRERGCGKERSRVPNP